jgi:hypothetical protein
MSVSDVRFTLTFKECLKAQRLNFVSAIQMLTLPENEEGRGWLSHFVGNDLASLNNKSSLPRLQNKDKFRLLTGYQIEKIEKKDEMIFVIVKELRVLENLKKEPYRGA